MAIISSPFLPKFPVQTPQHFPKTNHLSITCKISETNNKGSSKSSLQEKIFKKIDDFICTFMDSSLPPFLNPSHVLIGNFAPVDELSPTPCQLIKGSLPSCLNGAYIRNGPNPQFAPVGPYHMLDGDGMLHAVTISDGEATFCSRYVRTYKYVTEKKLGYPVFPSIFSSFHSLGAAAARFAVTAARVISGELNPIENGVGLANTSLVLLHGKLLALGESDLPYAVKITADGDLKTLGRYTFDDDFWSMTAHPKMDRETGEVFAYRYNVIRPFLTFFRISSDGRKQKDVEILKSMDRASLIHDFAITKNYAIFPDVQVVLDPMEVMRGRSPAGVDRNKVPRLGFIPRYATEESEMWWIEAAGFNMLHSVNSWEEDDGDKIVMIASNVFPVEHALDRLDLVHFSLERIEIDVKAKRIVSRCSLSSQSLDFGVINPEYAGKKNRFVYAAIMSPMPRTAGVVKLDLSLPCGNRVVASREYGPGCYGGEPIFVAREEEGEEDDGYIVTYVHDEIREESKFIVMDAKSPNLEIVADVKLPRRVPYGFHSLFVKEKDLKLL